MWKPAQVRRLSAGLGMGPRSLQAAPLGSQGPAEAQFSTKSTPLPIPETPTPGLAAFSEVSFSQQACGGHPLCAGRLPCARCLGAGTGHRKNRVCLPRACCPGASTTPAVLGVSTLRVRVWGPSTCVCCTQIRTGLGSLGGGPSCPELHPHLGPPCACSEAVRKRRCLVEAEATSQSILFASFCLKIGHRPGQKPWWETGGGFKVKGDPRARGTETRSRAHWALVSSG